MQYSDLSSETLRSIRLVSFDLFKERGSFPRFPDEKERTVTADSISQQQYDSSLFIFISHRWLRPCNSSPGWDGRDHPDNLSSNKWELCVAGIERIINDLTQNVTSCYLWIDYSCIDQDTDPGGELKQLDQIMMICDVIFTPIYDPQWAERSWPQQYPNMFEDYQSPDWTGTDFSSMKRGWCRIEMFFAANIPLLRQSENRNECFRRGLKFHRSQGRRPHLLFGTREKDDLKSGPQILPPLQNVYFARYHPEEGKLSKESDREKIKELVDHLLPLMKNLEPIYEGETLDDEKKVPHGKGKRIAEDGSWYAGDWQNGLRHGFGTSQTSAGGMYVGEWVNDKRNGYGTYSNPAGHVYSGNWSDYVLHGFGRYVYSNGEIYEGDWEEGRKNGHGKYFFANGDVYEGGFKLSKEHGYGKFIVGATQEVKYGIYEDGKLIKESTFPFMLP